MHPGPLFRNRQNVQKRPLVALHWAFCRVLVIFAIANLLHNAGLPFKRRALHQDVAHPLRLHQAGAAPSQIPLATGIPLPRQ